MVQTTLMGGKIRKILPGACDKREKGHRCGGDLIEFGKQLDKNNPDQYKCERCNKITIIEVLL